MEEYVKSLIAKHVPSGYRLCSGYIATTQNMNSSDNLLQHDIIIADDRIPSIYTFGYNDIEIVPAEAVCAVFEIKRTLNYGSTKEAVEHLNKTRIILEEYKGGIKSKKRCKNNYAGPGLSYATTAPIYGVFSLVSDGIDRETINNAKDFLDIVWSISDAKLMHLTWINNNITEIPLITARTFEGYNDNGYTIDVSWEEGDKNEIFSLAISCLRVWINNTSGLIKEMDSNTTRQYYGI